MTSSNYTGDEFSEKYKMYGDMLFKLSMVYLGNHVDAEEVMQEAFIKLLYKSPTFTYGDDEKKWLIRITINICKDKLKSFWRKNIVSVNEMQVYNEDVEDLQLSEIIMKLPCKYKTVIHLYYYEKYGVGEISQILHISESAVKMRLKRGREYLKIELEDTENE